VYLGALCLSRVEMKILHLIASIDPEGGGPLEYARLMAVEHEKAGHESVFVSLDSPDAFFLQDFHFPVHAAGPGKGKFAYTRNYGRLIRVLAPNVDVAVIHGLWNHATVGGHSALVAAGIPWVLFPHGMMDPYFHDAKPIKHWIKQIFWTAFQGRALSNAEYVLFTCEEEKILARRAFFGHSRYREKVVSFCASRLSAETEAGWKSFSEKVLDLGLRRYFLYLSRIHPKKACDQLIEAFAQVAEHDPNTDLVIAGPDQVGWQAELQSLAERLGIAKRIHWAGMVQGLAKDAAFARATAFILPSHQENFGLVVAEALSAGTPVLISDKVNIWREVVADGAGIVGPDTVDGTVRLLQEFMNLADSSRKEMEFAAVRCYQNRFSVESAAEDLLSVLFKAVSSPRLREEI
jgi:glycosyltransferase involved in cell wall biosynthesis